MYQSEIVSIVDALYENNYIEKTIIYKEVFNLLQIKGIKVIEDEYEKSINNKCCGVRK